jgi:hypothetical protein
LRISGQDDAKSVVRKYIVGTRSRHGKVASITIEEEPKGPDDKGTWVVKGNFLTEDGEREDFTAAVTAKGEVTMSPTSPKGDRAPSIFRR